jgi:hypothetical protein
MNVNEVKCTVTLAHYSITSEYEQSESFVVQTAQEEFKFPYGVRPSSLRPKDY